MARLGLTSPLSLVELAVSAATAAALETDLDRVIEVMLDRTSDLGAAAAALHLVDPARHQLRLVGTRNVTPQLARDMANIRFESPRSLVADVARREQMVHFENADQVPEDYVLAHKLFHELGLEAVLSVPLRARGKMLAVLTFGLPEAHAFSQEELTAVQAVADAFALALSAAQERAKVGRELRRMERVRNAALTISRAVDLPAVLQLIASEARRLTGASFAALGVIQEDAPDELFDPYVTSGGGLAPQALEKPMRPLKMMEGATGPVRAQDVLLDGELQGPTKVRHFLGTPILYGGRRIGDLYLLDKVGGEFTPEDALTVELMSQHVATAVEHARNHDALLRTMAEREQSEAALRESEARYRRLVENAPDVVFRLDLQPTVHFTFLSAAVEQLIGGSAKQYLDDASRLARQIHPSDRALLELALTAPERHGHGIILRWLHRDGRLVWVEARFVAVRDAKGKLLAVEGIARDVSAAKRAEREVEILLDRVRAKRAWLQAVIEHSPVGIVLVEDPDGHRIQVNREAQHLFGRRFRSDGGVAQIQRQLRQPGGQEIPVEEGLIMRALQGEAASAEERLALRPDGMEVPVLASATPIRDPEGDVEGAVVIYRDISALKDLERLREEWTSIVAHDLRQPVNVISLQASALVRHAPDPSVRARAEHILASSRQLARLISDLLEFSRIEARNLSIEREPMNLVALAKDVGYRTLAPTPDRPLEFEVDGVIPLVPSDAGRIEQVLTNLITNAVKYGYPGTPIRIEVRRCGDEAVVTVVNHGEGIAPEELPKLFGRFHRTEHARKSRVAGLGLGLYIIRGIIEAHGGRVWAESVSGGETRFSFSLPLQPSAELHAPH